MTSSSRILSVTLVLLAIVFASAAASGLTEIGIRLSVTREPSIYTIDARWTMNAGVYARFGVNDVWSIRTGLGTSLDSLSPYVHAGVLARVSPRMAVDTDVIAQWQRDPEIFGMAVRIGGVAVVAAGPGGRVTLGTSPLTWSLVRINGGFRNTIAFTPDLTLDGVRQTEGGWLFGSAATVFLIHGPSPEDPWHLGWRLTPHLGIAIP